MSVSYLYLLKQRRFLPLFLTQFFGAFNDNAFKLAMLTMISYSLTHNQSQSELFQAVAGALYIIPFFLLSSISGQLADKYDKALIARLIKVFELLLMILGGCTLYTDNIWSMMIILLGMGIHSTFFGPIKYAILPDHLPQEDILSATGAIEASTFLAILLGTTLGSLAVGMNSNPSIAIILILSAAFIGLIASLFIPPAPSVLTDLKVDYFFWRSTVVMIKEVQKMSAVFLCIIIISWFWLIGAIILTKLPDYTHYILGASSNVFALFLALFSIGIATGSLTIGALLNGRINLSIVPWAMLVFSLFTFDLYWASPSVSLFTQRPVKAENLLSLISFFSVLNNWRIAVDLFLLAFCSGIFVVPLYAYLQIASPVDARARTIAANNIFNALFMVLGTLLVMILLHLQATIPHVFLILCLLNAAAALVFWHRLRLLG